MIGRPPGAKSLLLGLSLSATICVLLAVISISLAGEWKGKRFVKDGVEYVANPAEPMEPPVIYDLREAWRLESETEEGELVFGTVDDVSVHNNGDIYLVDSQLKTVHVVSAEGVYQRSIGREGEGPGELRYPTAVVHIADNRIGVVDLELGRMTLLATDGRPEGEWRPVVTDYSRSYLLEVQKAPGGFVLNSELRRYPEGLIERSLVVALFDLDGTLQSQYVNMNSVYARGESSPFDEEYEIHLDLLGIDRSGFVYVSEGYKDIRIHVYHADGSLKRVITQEYDPVRRSHSEVEEETEFWKAYHGNPNKTLLISPYERSIATAYLREDGRLWIVTSEGWKQPQQGVAEVLEEFDSEGYLRCEVVILGDIAPAEDVVFLTSGHFFVVREGYSAQLTAHGAQRPFAEQNPSVEIPVVICYEMIARD